MVTGKKGGVGEGGGGGGGGGGKAAEQERVVFSCAPFTY